MREVVEIDFEQVKHDRWMREHNVKIETIERILKNNGYYFKKLATDMYGKVMSWRLFRKTGWFSKVFVQDVKASQVSSMLDWDNRTVRLDAYDEAQLCEIRKLANILESNCDVECMIVIKFDEWKET